jgi:hypothetical protein
MHNMMHIAQPTKVHVENTLPVLLREFDRSVLALLCNPEQFLNFAGETDI